MIRSLSVAALVLAAVLLPLGPLACSRCSSQASRGQPAAAPLSPALRTRYRAALARARHWLDELVVDPVALRARGIKGKKKLVEQLEAYYKLWQVALPSERPALLRRIREIVAVTYQDRYHDMQEINPTWFKQDATSYLRAALLMERLGLDTSRYRSEIRRIQPRLDQHLSQRGPNQRQTFHNYYKHFGMREPFPLAHALQAGVIAQRLPPQSLSTSQTYALTHEIYAVFDFGDRLEADPFDASARGYLAAALGQLVRRFMQRGNVDLVAELVECMHYLRRHGSPEYLAGVRYLLDHQKPDGSWGDYERYRPKFGDYVRQALELHTTMVAVEALAAVFDRPLPPLARRRH